MSDKKNAARPLAQFYIECNPERRVDVSRAIDQHIDRGDYEDRQIRQEELNIKQGILNLGERRFNLQKDHYLLSKCQLFWGVFLALGTAGLALATFIIAKKAASKADIVRVINLIGSLNCSSS